MNISKIALVLLSAALLPANARNKALKQAGNELPKPPEGYTLVWNDEFNGNSLDRDAWNIEVNGNGNGNDELQFYTDRDDNVSLGVDPASGCHCLILTAKRENYGGKMFTSGRITTADNMIFQGGIIESRIKFPKTANGLWPAFWLLGNDYDTNGWPRCGEIDILEMGNAGGISAGTQDRYFNGACHWGFYKDGNYPNYARSTTNSYSLQDGEFHTFTLVWDENFISMYLDRDKYPDAEPYYRMGVSDTSNDWGTGLYFQHDFFVIFNLAVGGRFTGILSPSEITALDDKDGEAKMYVDWVRVYQPNDNINAIVPDSYVTGIKKTVSVGSKVLSTRRFYDLLGRQVAKPNSKGLYIELSESGVRKILSSNS